MFIHNQHFMNFQLHKLSTFIILSIFSLSVNAQYTITGDFPPLTGQQVRLVGFEGFDIYSIDSTKVSESGHFALRYTFGDRGMGYLAAEDNKAYFVVLASEDILLKGEMLSSPESVICLSGKENQLFTRYAVEHPKRQQALSAWDYLLKIYKADSLFVKHKETYKAIKKEILRINNEDKGFLGNLDPDSYVSWYLPVRKLVTSVSYVAQYKTEEIPSTISAFRKLDYTDNRLYKSGLYRDVIDSHYWLLENMGQPLDTVFKEMNISTDYLIASLSNDEKKFNEITKYLFDLLEQRSLFQASEYLALKVLTQNSCTLNHDFANQLESYRAMKKGNTAPDIVFAGDIFKNGSVIETPKRLTEIKAAYTVVIFGAGWCPKCMEDLPQIQQLYGKWRSKGVEVVFVSLDTDAVSFKNFTKTFPFIGFCDYKKWETPAVVDYYVFATPTMFLLDTDLKIVLRPNSVKQIDAWIDYYIDKADK
jgi:thiol-disulfide isomerase/thioredoxin